MSDDIRKIYEAQYGTGPHVTADALVTYQKNILLIQRGGEYGHDQYALPGGFMNYDETTYETCIRELKEETRLDLNGDIFKQALISSKLFDDPNRSKRSRIITNVFYFDITCLFDSIPRVIGSDDAKRAVWMPFVFLPQRKYFFEDHYDIILEMIKI